MVISVYYHKSFILVYVENKILFHVSFRVQMCCCISFYFINDKIFLDLVYSQCLGWDNFTHYANEHAVTYVGVFHQSSSGVKTRMMLNPVHKKMKFTLNWKQTELNWSQWKETVWMNLISWFSLLTDVLKSLSWKMLFHTSVDVYVKHRLKFCEWRWKWEIQTIKWSL